MVISKDSVDDRVRVVSPAEAACIGVLIAVVALGAKDGHKRLPQPSACASTQNAGAAPDRADASTDP
jgi:hypothetical protein